MFCMDSPILLYANGLHVCLYVRTHVLAKPWLSVVSVIYHMSEASVINDVTPGSAMV